MFQQQVGMQSLLKEGGRHFSGVDEALLKNIEACKNLARITKTSLGPYGMNKLIVNHLGKHFVSSDTNTMVTELEVMHPAAKLLTMAAKAQEAECGDCTNFVVSFGGELLLRAEELLKEGIHASDVLKGYELARDKILQFLTSLKIWSCTDMKDVDQVSKCIKTALGAKQIGYADKLARLCAEACTKAMPPNPANFEVDRIRVTKIHGGNFNQSFVVEGMAISNKVLGTETFKENAKVAIYAQGIELSGPENKGTVLLNNADELMNYTKGEEQKMEEFIKGIKDAGCDVVISGGAVSEIAGHYLNKYRILCVKVNSKFELKRIGQTVGATSIIRTSPPLPEELGYVESIKQEEMASQRLTIVKTRDSKIATIVIRSASLNILEELERAIDNAVNVVRSVGKDPNFVPGAGATEIELAHQLQQFGATVPGLDQYAVLKFAEALEVVPKVLAENAGHSHVDAITALYAAHQKGSKNTGVEVDSGDARKEEGKVLTCDAVSKGLMDHMESKRWAIRFTVDAILTVLQVDQIIMSKQAGGPKGGDGGRDDD
jgi:T-complex protein 1 subunit theta